MTFRKESLLDKVLLAGLLLTGTACGSAGSSNNDQGTSVTFAAWCADPTNPQCTERENGQIVPLSSDIALGFAPFDGQTVIGYPFIQNRLVGQFVRIDRFDCDYDVQGGSVNVPSDSIVSGGVVESGAAVDGAPVTPSTGIFAIEVVSPDVYAFLNVNRNQLPELPFRMSVTCRGIGVTQSGDSISTNPLTYFVQFGDIAECCTANQNGGDPGFQLGGATGGDLTTFGGEDAAAPGATPEPTEELEQ